MQLHEVIWKDRFIDKIKAKHGVSTDEVEEILFGKPHVRRAQKGHVKGEDLYAAYGQTDDGRYLIVFFIHKEQAAASPISARDMTDSEQRDIMSDKQKQIDPLPEEFASYEEAAEFWDTHDTTDYSDSFETVAVDAELKHRRYEIETDEELMKALTEQAQKRGIGVNQLVSEMLKEKIRPVA